MSSALTVVGATVSAAAASADAGWAELPLAVVITFNFVSVPVGLTGLGWSVGRELFVAFVLLLVDVAVLLSLVELGLL
jgi:hypothetical protein